MPTVDQLHYVKVPNGRGGRAESVRLVYVLAGKPYADVLSDFQEAAKAVAGKNPFKQFPYVVTPAGRSIYQSLAIMHHAAQGTSAWPADPDQLTAALSVWNGAYDLYQAFGGFAADDLVAKKKFEDRRVPQYFGALAEIYGSRPYAAGELPCFADVVVHQALTWTARRNEVCKAALDASPALTSFVARFEAIPAVKDFLARQAAARAIDPAL